MLRDVCYVTHVQVPVKGETPNTRSSVERLTARDITNVLDVLVGRSI